MAVVAVAIMVSFHLKRAPTQIELKVAAPLGLIFWFLALACLGSGLHNYIKTVNHYSRRQAIVQSGLGTQLVRKDVDHTDLVISLTREITGLHRHCNGDRCRLHIVPVNRI